MPGVGQSRHQTDALRDRGWKKPIRQRHNDAGNAGLGKGTPCREFSQVNGNAIHKVLVKNFKVHVALHGILCYIDQTKHRPRMLRFSQSSSTPCPPWDVNGSSILLRGVLNWKYATINWSEGYIYPSMNFSLTSMNFSWEFRKTRLIFIGVCSNRD